MNISYKFYIALLHMAKIILQISIFRKLFEIILEGNIIKYKLSRTAVYVDKMN